MSRDSCSRAHVLRGSLAALSCGEKSRKTHVSLVGRRGPSAPAWYTRVIYIFGILRAGWKRILMFPSRTLEQTPFKGCFWFQVKKPQGTQVWIFFLNLISPLKLSRTPQKQPYTKMLVCFKALLYAWPAMKIRFICKHAIFTSLFQTVDLWLNAFVWSPLLGLFYIGL